MGLVGELGKDIWRTCNLGGKTTIYLFLLHSLKDTALASNKTIPFSPALRTSAFMATVHHSAIEPWCLSDLFQSLVGTSLKNLIVGTLWKLNLF